LLNPGFLSGPSMSEAVDAMFARMDQEKQNADRAGPAKQESTAAVEQREPSRKALTRQASDPVIAAHIPNSTPSEPAERSPIYRPSRSDLIASRLEKQTTAPVATVPSVKPSNVNEPSRPVPPSTPTTQLNVKWEN